MAKVNLPNHVSWFATLHIFWPQSIDIWNTFWPKHGSYLIHELFGNATTSILETNILGGIMNSTSLKYSDSKNSKLRKNILNVKKVVKLHHWHWVLRTIIPSNVLFSAQTCDTVLVHQTQLIFILYISQKLPKRMGEIKRWNLQIPSGSLELSYLKRLQKRIYSTTRADIKSTFPQTAGS